MSTIVKVRCTDQVLTFENTPVIASGGLEEDFVSFSFCGKWDGLGKTAVFWRSESDPYHVLLDEDDCCQIPPEVLMQDGVIYFGVFGVNAEGKQRTSEVLRYNIAKGTITEDTQPSDPTPNIYTQLMSYYAATRAEYEAARVDMVKHFDDLDEAAADHAEALEKQVDEHTENIRQMLEEAGKDLPAHILNKENPHNVTAAQLGLGNVDNTPDKDKPISDATKEALDNVRKEMEAAVAVEVRRQARAESTFQKLMTGRFV